MPGAQLFEDFCKDLVHRYCLEGTVVWDKVGFKACTVQCRSTAVPVGGLYWLTMQV